MHVRQSALLSVSKGTEKPPDWTTKRKVYWGPNFQGYLWGMCMWGGGQREEKMSQTKQALYDSVCWQVVFELIGLFGLTSWMPLPKEVDLWGQRKGGSW